MKERKKKIKSRKWGYGGGGRGWLALNELLQSSHLNIKKKERESIYLIFVYVFILLSNK